MKLVYNGVELAMAEIQEYQREAVYSADGTDLLYVKHRLSVVATCFAGGWPAGTNIAPGVNTLGDMSGSDSGGVPNGNVARSADRRLRVAGTDPTQYKVGQFNPNTWDNIASTVFPAGITDQELRMRLMIPRQKLRVSAYRPDGSEYVWLESPRAFQYDAAKMLATDAANGPLPLRCDVIQPQGEAAVFGVNFMIETCLVPTAPESERLILSHRWDVTHAYDEDFHLTRVTRGHVVFNGGIKRLTSQTPDWFLSTFMHPIPLGFRRNLPEVRATSDGLGVQYTITDTDPRVVFDPGDSGATSMEIVESVNYYVPNALTASIGAAVNGVLNGAANPAPAAGAAAGAARPPRITDFPPNVMSS